MSFFPEGEIREEELAALADGSLPPERQAVVEAHVQASPELAAALDEQRRAVSALRGAAGDVDAPAALRSRIEAERARRRALRVRRPLGFAIGFAAAAVTAAALVLVGLPGGGPSIAEAADLATKPPTEPAPPPLPGEPKLLDADVEGVVFPGWDEKFGWRATGARADELDGREAETVYYAKDGKRIAYTIVGGEALDVPGDGRPARREGTDVYVLESGDRTVVTWERHGRTCVLTGVGVPAGTLVKLAAWKGKGAVEF
jgi:hypothetical protein